MESFFGYSPIPRPGNIVIYVKNQTPATAHPEQSTPSKSQPESALFGYRISRPNLLRLLHAFMWVAVFLQIIVVYNLTGIDRCCDGLALAALCMCWHRL